MEVVTVPTETTPTGLMEVLGVITVTTRMDQTVAHIVPTAIRPTDRMGIAGAHTVIIPTDPTGRPTASTGIRYMAINLCA